MLEPEKYKNYAIVDDGYSSLTEMQLKVLEKLEAGESFTEAYESTYTTKADSKTGQAVFDKIRPYRGLIKSQTLISQQEARTIEQLMEMANDNHYIRDVLIGENSERVVETEVYWEWDEHTPCKSKIDAFISPDKIIDVKTTSKSINEWIKKSVRDYNYLRQLAFYARAIEKTTGTMPANWEFVVCTTQPICGVHVVSVSPQTQQHALRQLDETMGRVSWHFREKAWEKSKEEYLTGKIII